MKSVNPNTIFRKIYERMELARKENRDISYLFNEFFHLYLILVNYGYLTENTDCQEIINKIYFITIGATRDQIIDIGKKWAEDTAHARAIGHNSFSKQTTDNELYLYERFMIITTGTPLNIN